MQHVSEREISDILPDAYLDLSNDIRAVTLEIMNHTIHYTRDNRFMTNNGLVVFAKQIAKDLARPYIPRGHWWVEIPLKKYLDPLHAPLRLVAVEMKPGGIRFKDTPHIAVKKNTVYASYNVYTEEGKAVLEDWFKRTQEDPDMRAALRLPPK